MTKKEQSKVNAMPQAKRPNVYNDMMKFVLTFVLGLVLFTASAQTKFEGEIIHAGTQQFLLCEHFGDNVRVVDTIYADEDNRFLYHMDTAKPKGLYRLYLNDNEWLEFILGCENVKFRTIADAPVETLEILESGQNKKLYRFYQMLDENQSKKIALQDFVRDYPETDRLISLSEKALIDIYKEEQGLIDELEEKMPEAFVTRYLRFLYENPREAYLNDSREINIKTVAEKNWEDSLLLNSDAYARKLIDYLSLYSKPDAGKVRQSQALKQAIDSIFAFIPAKNPVYDYAMIYLMEGFEQYEMENLIMYLVNNYADNCNKTQGKLENRLSFYSEYHNGAEVPDFITTDTDGEPVQFYEHVHDKTLLVFWATWCGHCKQMNQALKEIYPRLSEKNIDVISFSLDTNASALKSYLKNAGLPWPVWSDFQGWDSELAETFHLYATPTMLLIDEDKTIIGKPLNMNQLVYMINDIQ